MLEAALRAVSRWRASFSSTAAGSRRRRRRLRARFAAGEYKELVRGLFEQMFTRAATSTLAAAPERALALPEDVGRALLLSLVRYDVDSSSARSSARQPLLVLQTTTVNERRERASLRPGQTTPYLDFIRAKVPGARVEVLPGIGHFPRSTRRPKPTGRSELSPAYRCQTLRSDTMTPTPDTSIDCRVMGIRPGGSDTPASLLRRLHLVEREHEVLLVERLVAGEAALEVALSLTVLSALNAWYSHSPLRMSSAIFGAPAGALLHHRVGDQVALMKRPLASFSGSPAGVELGLVLTMVSTVPLGIGWPALTASIASCVA